MPLHIPVKTSFGLNEEMKIVLKEHSRCVVDPIHEQMLKLSIKDVKHQHKDGKSKSNYLKCMNHQVFQSCRT